MTDEIARHLVDGVPVLHATRRGGRYRAGLLFRVGRADETLAIAGITHLVEHLALHQQGVGEFHYNGATADLFTHFHVEGSAHHVVEYFESVCASLRHLPMHRLEIEKQILRTEQAGRGTPHGNQISLFRYGAQGFGLSSYPELGLQGLTPDRVRHWASSHFTKANAVLWVVGESVPDDLRLDLPAGQRMPTPAVTSVLPSTPSWFQAVGDTVILHAVVPRSTEAKLFASVLSRALFADLRQTRGYSYTAQAEYQVLDAEHAVVIAVADSAPAKGDAVVGAFIDVLARLGVGTISVDELETVRSSLRRSLDDSEAHELVPGQAAELLLGRPSEDLDKLKAEVDAVTLADLRRVAAEVHAAALIQSPTHDLTWAGFSPAPLWSDGTVSGKTFQPVAESSGTLVVGRDGVSLHAGGKAVTVMFADCVLMQSFPDGGRRLFGRDGFSIAVEPTLHPIDQGTLDTLTASVPASAVVRMPPRDDVEIPQPESGTEQPKQRVAAGSASTGPTGARGRIRRAASVVLAIVALLLLLVAVASTFGVGEDEDLTLGTLIVLWVFAALPAWLAWELRRPRTR